MQKGRWCRFVATRPKRWIIWMGCSYLATMKGSMQKKLREIPICTSSLKPCTWVNWCVFQQIQKLLVKIHIPICTNSLHWTDVHCSGRGKDSNQSLVESFQIHFSFRKQTIWDLQFGEIQCKCLKTPWSVAVNGKNCNALRMTNALRIINVKSKSSQGGYEKCP